MTQLQILFKEENFSDLQTPSAPAFVTDWFFCSLVGLALLGVVSFTAVFPLLVASILGGVFALFLLMAGLQWLADIVGARFPSLVRFLSLHDEFGSHPPASSGSPRVSLSVGPEGIFDGVYVSHWEVSRFEVELLEVDGRIERPLGYVDCELVFPEHINPPWFRSDDDWDIDAPGDWRYRYEGSYDVRLAGRVIEHGSFGHMGGNKWRIEVTDLIAAQQQSQLTQNHSQGYRQPLWEIVRSTSVLVTVTLVLLIGGFAGTYATTKAFEERFGDGWGVLISGAVIVAFFFYVFLWSLHRLTAYFEPPRPGKSCPLSLGREGLFEGMYISHWQIPRFQLRSAEYDGVRKEAVGNCWCALTLPQNMPLPWFGKWNGQRPLGWVRMEAMPFRVRFRGRMVEKGIFGYKGWCRWRLEVAEILLFEEDLKLGHNTATAPDHQPLPES